MTHGLLESIKTNAGYVLGFAVIIAVTFLIAYACELVARKKNGITKSKMLDTRSIVIVGLFSAISFVLMFLDFPVPFAPGFYQMDFSDLPALIGAFAFGPLVGVLIEFVKILLKLVIEGTSTAFVGELANFVIGCSFILPASIVYLFKKNRKTAFISCIVGTLVITLMGTTLNAFYLLPAYAALYGMPMENLIAAGTAINPAINNVFTFVIICVAPLNLLKGGADSVITLLIYKKLSPILKNSKVGAVAKSDADKYASDEA